MSFLCDMTILPLLRLLLLLGYGLQWVTNSNRYDLVYVTKINSTTCAAETPSAASGDFQELDGDTCYDAHPGGELRRTACCCTAAA